jgi:aryl-alcohol dehydrogenase-like predicted oxidoreductase
VQLPYSLIARGIEPEFVPMAQTLGLGLTAWSPVGGGLLTGKYRRTGAGLSGAGRLTDGGAGRPVSDHDWRVIEALGSVAADLGRSMVQVAINWVATQPAVASVVIGASSAGQLDGNLAALDFEIPAGARRRLDEASAALPPGSLYTMFTPQYQSRIVSPGLGIGDKPAGYAPSIFHGSS